MSLKHQAGRDSLIEVSVKDNGIGISEDDLQKVFTPYFRTQERQS